MKSSKSCFRVWMAAASLAFLCEPLPAQDPPKRQFPGVPKVDAISPRGWRRGAEVEVEITGSRLANPRAILCLTTGAIKATKFSADPKPENAGKIIRATLEIGADCPLGQHLLRLCTDYGLGDAVVFSVGPLDTAAEAEPLSAKSDQNAAMEQAEAVEMDRTVNGVINGPEEDTFRFTAESGQVFSAEVECARLATSETDDGAEILLSVRNAAGKVLASSDDTALFLSDPFVSLTVPEGGPLFVSLKPLIPGQQGRRIPYRLHAGRFLRPSGIYPAGGRPGSTLQAQLLGLPEKESAAREIALPKEAPVGAFAWAASPGTPNPNVLRLLDAPNTLEKEPNNNAGEATPADSGGADAAAGTRLACNGILEKNGDVDCFRFPARKGERLLVETFGQALGSPVDLQISLLPADAKPGQNPDKADDSTDTETNTFESGTVREKLDPRMLLTPKEDREYVLTVRDSRSQGGPLSIYRVHISPVRQGMLAGLFSQDNNARQVRNSLPVGRGNRTLAFLNLRTLYGTEKIDGDLQLKIPNLPKGVSFRAAPFSADKRRVPVLFEAAEDAEAGPVALDVRIEPVQPPAEGAAPWTSAFRHTLGLVYSGNDYTQSVTVDRLSFTVTDTVPFRVKATPPSMPLSRNSELTIDVELERLPGYNENVEIVVESPPQGISPQPGVVLKSGELRKTLRLSAEGGAPLGKHQIVITARNQGDGRVGRLYSATEFLTLEVADPFLRLKLGRTAVERGKSATVTAQIERLRPLPGKAHANLIRLPRGLAVVGGPVEVPGEGDKMTFQVEASPDALVGAYPSVACEITVSAEGREMKQVAGYGLVRIDPSRGPQK